VTVRNHPLISDDSYDEALAFPELPLREQVANRLADALWAADQIMMLIDERLAQAPRDIIDLLPRVRALYDGANTLMKEVEN
jgi:hypothetical protein